MGSGYYFLEYKSRVGWMPVNAITDHEVYAGNDWPPKWQMQSEQEANAMRDKAASVVEDDSLVRVGFAIGGRAA